MLATMATVTTGLLSPNSYGLNPGKVTTVNEYRNIIIYSMCAQKFIYCQLFRKDHEINTEILNKFERRVSKLWPSFGDFPHWNRTKSRGKDENTK